MNRETTSMTRSAEDKKLKRKRVLKRTVRKTVLYVVLTVIGMTMVLPFIWMLSTSLKTRGGAIEIPPSWIPRESLTMAELADSERPVPVSILSKISVVRDTNTNEEYVVYEKAVFDNKSWWAFWSDPVPSARRKALFNKQDWLAGRKQSIEKGAKFAVNVMNKAFDDDSEGPAVVPVEVLSTMTRVRIVRKRVIIKEVDTGKEFAIHEHELLDNPDSADLKLARKSDLRDKETLKFVFPNDEANGKATVPVRVLPTSVTVKLTDTGKQFAAYQCDLQASTASKDLMSVDHSRLRDVETLEKVFADFGEGRKKHDVKVVAERVPEDPDYLTAMDLKEGESAYKHSWVSLKWDNYPTTWNKLPFGRGYINTIIMAVCITIGQVVTCSLAAFAFARLRFPGRDKLFLGYLATMMIPGAVTLIPVYILFVKTPEALDSFFTFVLNSPVCSWMFDGEVTVTMFTADLYFLGKYYVGRLIGGNSYFALIAPGLFSAYGTFMLRQFFMGLPRELEDAARIDGCGNLRIYWHVTLPLSKVALATLATFTFMGSWKAFMWPLIINNNEKLMPLQVLLQRFKGQYGAEYTLLMAGSIIVLIPILIVFLFGQRYFIKGIQLGGVKG